ncbi:MLP-like protein 28 [Eucalyptus grandis]|uniref:Bet v I/Major latex protein domain-containing protein n=4 Tax=Eucalyptus TaxID=3932 RepID=A0A059D7N1_EUCGR|nr:MLP-like protein 28 [Eucalyptus grandis]XP_010044198.1 MLP-like protein 28 [Eucalyptus grandis]KAK3442596.1 hypothetical protein EUGRSUZ_B02925 [Eucalyptus grandis]KAK3442597.1 hypothetical protein EUGRSUZ_B02925 [Eucalyptus grandis]
MGLEGKLEFEVEIQSSADEFYNIWRNHMYHLPNASSDAVQSVQLHEGEWHSEDAVKLWTYTVEGKTLTVKERIEVDDANKVLIFNIIGGDLLEEFKTFKAIVKMIAKSDGRGSLAKWTLEYEKLHEGVADPTACKDLEIKLTKDTDAHIINNA